MITIRTAYTTEIDEPALAVREIIDQLNPGHSLAKNSIGIVSCHVDSLKSGVLKAVSDVLPFPVVGITTLGSATEDKFGLDILTLSVLTSDDVSFSPALTDSLAERQEDPIRNACVRAAAALPDTPSLILAFGPMLSNVGGEKLVNCVDKAVPGVPVFGTLTCDHNFDFHEAQTIYEGEPYRDRMALVVMSGPVNARFLTISVPEGNVQKQSAVITESENNIVRQVNGKPVLEYLSSLGLTRQNGLEGSKNIPIILGYNDGTQPVTRCFYMISPEGHAVCGGEMPTGATFAIGSMEYEDVLTSADQVLDRVLKNNSAKGMLIVPCIVRSVTLGTDQMAEAARVAERVGKTMPYHLCYSGGEICPVYGENGRTTNRFHNFSFTVCVFS